MKIRPRNDYVLVELDSKPEAATPGNFGLDPDSVHERQRGTVLDSGPGRVTIEGIRIPINLSVGTRILLFPGHGQTVDDNEDVLLLREDSILGIIDNEV